MPSIICGLDGRVVWANDAWVRLSGFSRVEILSFDHLVQLTEVTMGLMDRFRDYLSKGHLMVGVPFVYPHPFESVKNWGVQACAR